jgi:3-isopropylmalate/(R)-2-methylmalate dehydratase small subunit
VVEKSRLDIRGRCWKFDGVLDVDWQICPFTEVRELQWYRLGDDAYAELGKFCMTKVDPDFPDKVSPGDVLVARDGMGFGHDHSQACASIRGAGVSAVLCETAAPYFLRNSFDHGLPVLEVPGIFDAISQGDLVEVNITTGRILDLTSGVQFVFTPVPDFLVQRILSGGVYPYLMETVLRSTSD